MLILGCEVKFQQDLEIAWVLFTLFFYVLSWCLNIVRSSMEKYKLKRLLFFSHFINSYSCLHINIKKWEGHWRLLIWQLFHWPLRNHLFPSLPHIFFLLATLGHSQGTPHASLDLLLSCLLAGQLQKLTRKSDTAYWGQETAELLRNVGPVERQTSLEYTKVGSFHECWLHMYLCGPGGYVCICSSVGHLSDPS